jgi:hypothetical protein
MRAARCVAIAASVVAAGCSASTGSSTSNAEVAQVVKVGPQPGTLSQSVIRLSIDKHQQVRWVAEAPLKIGFPASGFPSLADGTRVTDPPFADMAPGSLHPDIWFFPEFNSTVCGSGEINPAMSILLDRAPGRRLDFVYTYTFQGNSSVAHLIIEY